MARVPARLSKAWDTGERDYFRGGYNPLYSPHPLEQDHYTQGYLYARQQASHWLAGLESSKRQLAHQY